MNRKTALVIAGAASAAIALLTTGAFAGTSGRSDQPGVGSGDLVSCLAAHGVQVPTSDPAGVKQWLGEHSQDDPAVRAALNACAGPDTGGTDSTPAELIACLEQHRVDVPSNVTQDPSGAFKQWLAGANDQPTVQSAVDDCTGGTPPSGHTK